jgi:hypothetical protein
VQGRYLNASADLLDEKTFATVFPRLVSEGIGQVYLQCGIANLLRQRRIRRERQKYDAENPGSCAEDFHFGCPHHGYPNG